ncbi:MAG: cupin domain-containing protein [Pseudomonadota bacterium]
MPGHDLSFSDLIAPMSADAFMRDGFGQKPVHIQADPGARSGLLTWDGFNEALAVSRYWTDARLRIIMGSRFAMPQHYCDDAKTLDGQVMLANADKVRAFLGMGASMVANQIDGVSPTVKRYARVLQQHFGAKIAANVYCSFCDVQAFETHYDLHDVFAVQTEGEKVWRIWEGRADTPIHGLPDGEGTSRYLQATKGRLLFEAHMKPGDVLYLPRGQYHDALASSSASLHVTFSISPVRGIDVIDVLRDEAEGEALFRSYVPDGRADRTAIKAYLQAMAQRLAAMAGSDALLDAIALKQASFDPGPDDYALPHTPDLTFYAPTGQPSRIERRDEGYMLLTQRENIILGKAHRAASWMLQQPFFSDLSLRASYPELSEDEARLLVQSLVNLGLIAQTQPQGLPVRKSPTS